MSGRSPQIPGREPWTPWGKWLKQRRKARQKRKQERTDRREARRRARQLRRMRRRRFAMRGSTFLVLLIFACAIGLIVLLLLGQPYPWQAVSDVVMMLDLRGTIDENEARWESLAVTNYRVEVTYRDETQGIRCGPGQIVVTDGELLAWPDPTQANWFPVEECDRIVRGLTIEHSFDTVRAAADEFVPGRNVILTTFDAEFGYPLSLSIEEYNPDRATPGCCWYALWDNLELIDP